MPRRPIVGCGGFETMEIPVHAALQGVRDRHRPGRPRTQEDLTIKNTSREGSNVVSIFFFKDEITAKERRGLFIVCRGCESKNIIRNP